MKEDKKGMLAHGAARFGVNRNGKKEEQRAQMKQPQSTIIDRSVGVTQAIYSNDYIYYKDESMADLYNLYKMAAQSPTLRNIVSDITQMVVSEGFLMKPDGNEEQFAKFVEWVEKTKLISKVLHPVVKMYAGIAGYGALEVKTASISGVKGMHAHFIPNEFMAFGFPSNGIDIEFIGIADDIKALMHTKQLRKLEQVPVGYNSGLDRFALLLTDYSPGCIGYPLPPWIGATNYVILEGLIAAENLRNLRKGFTGKTLIQMFGAVTETEARTIRDSVLDAFTGEDGADVFVQVLDDERLKAIVSNIGQTGRKGEYLELADLARGQIVVEFGWSPALIGISQAGQLGSNQQLILEYHKVSNKTIRPIQLKLIEDVMTPLADAYCREILNSDRAFELDMSNTIPVSFMGDIDINRVLPRYLLAKEAGFDVETVKEYEAMESPKNVEQDDNTGTD